jgi:hypothetical protein
MIETAYGIVTIIIGAGVITCALFLVFEFMREITIGHIIAVVLIGIGIAAIFNNYTDFWAWIYLGVTFANIGAVVFTAGLVAVMAIMIYNFASTIGQTLVR